MNEFLKMKKIRLIIWNAVLVILGLLFCFLPETALSVLETIVAVCLIVYGVFCLFAYLFTPMIVRDSSFLVSSILYILAGVLLMSVESLFKIGIGVFIVIQGVAELGYGEDLKLYGDKKFWVDALLGFLFLVLGIVVIILSNTSVATTIVSLIIGISLIIYACGNLYLILVLHRTFEKLKRRVERADNDEDDTNDFKDYNVK